MNYREAITFLFDSLPMFQRTGKAAYKSNLDNTLRLDRYFGSPHNRFRTIHIAGTNGKGSVSHMLASILAEAGYKTGLYTSPHLLDFRERIRINGRMIPKREITDFVRNHSSVIGEVQPSFFEMTVALAFDYFARKNVQVAVVETGLGGRLDSTNIIRPEISIITNISMDHTEFLGDTLPAIAREKAGIIKPGVPVVIGPSDPSLRPVFQEKAAETHSELLWAEERYECRFSTLTPENRRLFRMADRNSGNLTLVQTDLLGDYQAENIATVLSVLETLDRAGWLFNREQVEAGFNNVVQNTGLRGRWEVLGQNPRIVCDTGHNRAGLQQVLGQINQTPWKHLHMVIGFVDDKDIGGILELLPAGASYYFARASVPRALDQHILKQKAWARHLQGDAFGTVKEAFSAAKEAADPDDMIFIGGSTFVVADLLAIM